MGIVIRDELGVVKASSAQLVKATVSPLVAEAMAVLCGIHLALDSGLCPFQVETDSLSVVNLVIKGCPPLGDVGTVIGDILALLDTLPACSVIFAPRKANVVAHCLARLALSSDFDVFWSDFVPPYAEALVQADVLF